MANKMKCDTTRINIAFILIIMMLASGCQQAPESTPVVYGGDILKKIDTSSASIATYNAPASWQETLDMKGSDTKIEINASISIPNVTVIPIYKVKAVDFDNIRVESLVKYFTKGEDVTKYTEPTKAELEKQLILAKKYNAGEETVTELEKMIAAAPETVEAEKIVNWSVDQSPAGSFIDEYGEYAGINVAPKTFSYKKGYIKTENRLSMNGKDKIGDIVISEEDAISAAKNMLNELGVNYMIADSLEKAQLYAEFSEEPTSKGYLIKFARIVDGIACIANGDLSFYVTDEFDYKAPLYPEKIQIYVDEAGNVQSFLWTQPLKIEEKISENTGLLSFEEIKKKICNMLIFINSYDNKPTNVTSVEMRMTIVNVKDHPEEAMYVPAWFIHYSKIYGDIQQEYTLVLNAIDGGRILELPVDISPEIQSQMAEDREALN